jgi:hypothetical protein
MLVFQIYISMPDDGLSGGPKHVALLTQTMNSVMLDGSTVINIESRHNEMNCNKIYNLYL